MPFMYLWKNVCRGSDAVFCCKKGVVFDLLTGLYAVVCSQLSQTA